MELAVSVAAWHDVIKSVLGGERERCAVLLAYQVERPRGLRLLAHQLVVPDDSEYARVGPLEAELSPGFVARISKLALRAGYSIVFLHSHPGRTAPRFSHVDDYGEERLAKFFAQRNPSNVHLSMVVSDGGVCCRRLGSTEGVRVAVIGPNRRIVYDPDSPPATSAQYDRQIRLLGDAGQSEIGRLHVGIVGLGGTGSLIVEQLVHLGVCNFILLDPDVVEESNLNRIANALPVDVGKPKVDVAQRFIKSFRSKSSVISIKGDVIWARDAKALLDADFLFGCTDSHGSRSVLEQIAYQFLLPLIDMGTVISKEHNEIKRIVGRVQMLAPSLQCFTCGGLLSPDQVRRDMMTTFERQSDPYFQGGGEPAPAVMSLNSTVASLAVTMMLASITPLPVPGRHLLYMAMSSSLRTIGGSPDTNCIVCSPVGRLARGNSWPFPGRQD